MFTTQFQRSYKINEQKKKYEEALCKSFTNLVQSDLNQILDSKPILQSLKDRVKAKELIHKFKPMKQSLLSHELSLNDLSEQKYLN